ncbi:MAG: M10 family metallopeptidase C-terminal domain-containing protein [Rhodospirillales bacterium]
MASRYPDGLFDEAFYLARNPDVAAAVAAGVFASGRAHYELYGARELRDPNASFDSHYYALQNADVLQAVAAGQFDSVYEHFLLSGAREGRKPSADLDLSGYLAANPDVAAAVSFGLWPSGYHHYVLYGKYEGRPGINVSGGNNTLPGINGTEGNDTLAGTAAGETMRGLGGNDTIEGGQGNDTLEGGNGEDRLVGGPGIDRMTGGDGADTFHFQNESDSPQGSPDVITDFNGAAGDRIHLASLVWPPVTFIGAHTNPFSAGNFTEIRFNDTTKILEIDSHGDGTADIQIKLEGVALADLAGGYFTGTTASS